MESSTKNNNNNNNNTKANQGIIHSNALRSKSSIGIAMETKGSISSSSKNSSAAATTMDIDIRHLSQSLLRRPSSSTMSSSFTTIGSLDPKLRSSMSDMKLVSDDSRTASAYRRVSSSMDDTTTVAEEADDENQEARAISFIMVMMLWPTPLPLSPVRQDHHPQDSPPPRKIMSQLMHQALLLPPSTTQWLPRQG